MKVLHCDRTVFYEVASAAFKILGVDPLCIEVGVFKGDNAKEIHTRIRPRGLYLVDAWSEAEFVASYSPLADKPEWLDDPSSQFNYYGGDATTNELWENIYRKVVLMFSKYNEVSIHRSDSAKAAKMFKRENLKFDFIYIDSSHQYEYVFRDLMFYRDLASDDSMIQLNDCCHSEYGVKQNLGVLEAVVKFIKVSGYKPICINTKDFSDILLVPPVSKLGEIIDDIFFNSNLNYIEVPVQILGASFVRVNKHGKSVLSFC